MHLSNSPSVSQTLIHKGEATDQITFKGWHINCFMGQTKLVGAFYPAEAHLDSSRQGQDSGAKITNIH